MSKWESSRCGSPRPHFWRAPLPKGDYPHEERHAYACGSWPRSYGDNLLSRNLWLSEHEGEIRECCLSDRNVDFDPLSQLIAEDAQLDLATIALKHEQIGAITADGEIGSCVFSPVAWPPPALSPGESIAFGGFPGRLRERPAHDEVVFPSWSSAGGVVASVSEDRFSCQFEREFWVASFGAKHHMELRDLGGLSSGPAFIHRGLYWDFVGVVYEFSQEFDIMFFRPGNLIDAHGLIHGPHV